ncbi:MAG TPA: hypothetical protein VMY43_03680 [Methanothrix sp.]|nr:hypothetical protein [Methanothrix sp.]
MRPYCTIILGLVALGPGPSGTGCAFVKGGLACPKSARARGGRRQVGPDARKSWARIG